MATVTYIIKDFEIFFNKLQRIIIFATSISQELMRQVWFSHYVPYMAARDLVRAN